MVTPLVDMEMDDEAKMDSVMPISTSERPEYPWGLRISLCGDEMDKLNLDPSEAFVGGIVTGRFISKITSVSASDGDFGSSCRVELQITALALGDDGDGDDDSQG